MGRLNVSDYAPAHLKTITANARTNFAVQATEVENTHCYAGGKDNTTAILSVHIGSKAVLPLKVTFDLAGIIDSAMLPTKAKLSATKMATLDHLHASEFYVLLAQQGLMDTNMSYTVKGDSNRATVMFRVGSHTVIGTMSQSCTLALARALSLGVGTVIQSDVDAIIKELADLFANEK